MKTYRKFILTLFILTIGTFMIKAAVDVSDLIQSISNQLESSDLEKIENAKKIIEEANRMIDELSSEDQRLEKYFKKKEKKGEKKAVYAKQYRIDAANKYFDGLSTVHDILNERLNFAIFEYPEDKSSADKLIAGSSDLFNTIKQNLLSFQGLSKKDLTGLGYYTLISELESNLSMMLDGINKQKDAFNIWAIQTDKKQKDVADENAWKNALNTNTIDGYNKYLTDFSNGKFVVDAKNKIAELEAQAKLAEEERLRKEEEARLAELERQKQLEAELAAKKAAEVVVEQDTSGLIYGLQIMAVYFKVDSARLATIYCGNEKLQERYEDAMYKYIVGEFKTFKEAKEYRRKLSMPSFIVAFQNGERISTNDARKMEAKPQKKSELKE